jgi:alpha-L-rhamnosidase
LYSNIDWGQRANFISVPTDCPQRDERLGWLGDAQIFVRTAAYNRDVAAFFSKWLDDVADAQLPSGAFSDFAPRLGHDWAGAPAWADAGVIVPWTVYKMYGDKGVLERHFERMRAWMGFLSAGNPGRLRAHQLGNNYGDWLAPKGDRTPRELLATAYWAYDAALMAEIAETIGVPEEAARYRQLAEEIRQAFCEAYVGPDGQVQSGTQTAYVLALHMGLVPDELRPSAAAHLVDAIARDDWHLDTGFVGVGYLLPVLSSNGYSDVAYRVLEQRSFPSWQYTIDRGATTIWERWDGWTEERGFHSPRMNSFNHYSLGSVGEWLYRFVLGMELAPGAAGFDRLVIRPHPGGSLTYAQGAFRSVRGEISTAWARDGDRFRLDVEVPPNVRASVRVPSARPSEVVDGDGAGPVSVADYPGAIGQKEAVFEVGSGNYSFSGPEPVPSEMAPVTDEPGKTLL